jgi:hypothetical protein
MREKTECKMDGKDYGRDGIVRVCVLTRVDLWLRSYASPPQTCAFVLPSPWRTVTACTRSSPFRCLAAPTTIWPHHRCLFIGERVVCGVRVERREQVGLPIEKGLSQLSMRPQPAHKAKMRQHPSKTCNAHERWRDVSEEVGFQSSRWRDD